MTRFLAVHVILMLAVAGTATAQQPTFQDLDYVGRGNVRQFLDLYIPPVVTAPRPLIMYIHGGGWQSGSKGNAMQFCDTLLARRYIVADINYRLSSDSIFPAQIFDAKAAIRWLKANAGQYNIDTCRIAVTGSSAGGHLAMLLGTSGGVDSLEDFGLGNATVTSRVHAVIPFYGVSDFHQLDGHAPNTPPDSCTNPFVHDTTHSPETRLLGCRISHCPDRARMASPNTYITPDDPPFMLYHGTFDCEVPPRQSIVMDSVLRAASVPSTLRMVLHAQHAFRPSPFHKQQMLSFLNQNLVSCSPTSVDESLPGEEGFTLYQNYPNPFNPRTTIRYRVPTQTFVELKVLDVLGREVATLVKDVMNGGEHSVSFEADHLASGVYFYRIHAGSFVTTRKLLLAK